MGLGRYSMLQAASSQHLEEDLTIHGDIVQHLDNIENTFEEVT